MHEGGAVVIIPPLRDIRIEIVRDRAAERGIAGIDLAIHVDRL